jgi:hypothetical protein
MILWTPSGDLNIAHDPSDLPEVADRTNLMSGAMVRCKNLRLDERGKARTRDGSAKLNATAISTALTWLEVQGGTRYAFGGGNIYEDEVSLVSGLDTAAWSAIQYNAYNDTALNIFAMNGTDRKRVESGAVYEWGIAAPTIAPVLTVGSGKGLTGEYNAKYTYVRKVGTVVVAESDPSPAADATVILNDQSLAASVTQPSDTQVTHIRLYRTQDDGETYLYDSEISASTGYAYGYMHDWEESEDYIVGNGFHFTTTSSVVISDGTGTGASGETPAGGTVAISNQYVLMFDASSATAGYRLDSDGAAYQTVFSGAYVAIGGEWLLSGSAADYEARATKVSGTTPSGTLGSWLALSSDRTWSLTTTAGNASCVLTIEIRNATTLAVLDTATITLEAEAGTF